MKVNDIVLKLKRIIKEGFSDFLNFGFKMMLAKDLCIITDDSTKSLVYKNKVIVRYLKKKFSYLIDKYKNLSEPDFDYTNSSDLPIWVFWWQGEENMPVLIKACHKSKIQKANNHPVMLIDKENLEKYITLPDYVWEQFNSGKLRIQHLSDMLRVKLIKEYGGLWLDGSVYCVKEIPDNIFRLPVYSLKIEDSDHNFISDNKWTTFTIGGQKNNLLCSFLDDFFMEYCKTGKPFIDYFMFDCAIALAKEIIPAVEQSLNSIPFNNGDYRWINKHIYDECNSELLENMKSDGSVFYKIAWNLDKNKFKQNSLYHYLIKKEDTNE